MTDDLWIEYAVSKGPTETPSEYNSQNYFAGRSYELQGVHHTYRTLIVDLNGLWLQASHHKHQSSRIEN